MFDQKIFDRMLDQIFDQKCSTKNVRPKIVDQKIVFPGSATKQKKQQKTTKNSKNSKNKNKNKKTATTAKTATTKMQQKQQNKN